MNVPLMSSVFLLREFVLGNEDRDEGDEPLRGKWNFSQLESKEPKAAKEFLKWTRQFHDQTRFDHEIVDMFDAENIRDNFTFTRCQNGVIDLFLPDGSTEETPIRWNPKRECWIDSQSATHEEWEDVEGDEN